MCAQPGTGMAGGRGMGQGRGMGRCGAGGRGMGRGQGQGQGMGQGQGAAQNMGQSPAEPGAAMTPRDYLVWLEAELARTREKVGQEG